MEMSHGDVHISIIPLLLKRKFASLFNIKNFDAHARTKFNSRQALGNSNKAR